MPGTERRQITLSDPVAFFLLGLLIHLPLISLNRGEFTDGILQLNVLRYKIGLYPPLFGALANALAFFGLNPETAGRIISAAAASALVFPVWGMMRLLAPADHRAARLSLILLTCSPLLMRWSLHAMSDSLFTLLSSCCLWMAGRAVYAAGDGNGRQADNNLAGAVTFAVAATLTRYQGALLTLPGLLALVSVWRSSGWLPVRTFVASLLWLSVPAWMAWNGFGHSSQFADRATTNWLSTLFVYLNCAENFVLTLPYHFSYPVTALAILGCFKGCLRQSDAAKTFLWIWGIWYVAVLILQSAFQTFQYRYFLPVLPVFLIFAGMGGSYLFERFSRKTALWILGLCCAGMVCTAAGTLFGQYQSFGDQRLAMRWVTENVPAQTPVYGNERYGTYTRLGCPKWDVWSERTIRPFWTPEDAADMPDGSVVVLSDAYGGPAMAGALSAALVKQSFTLEPQTMFTSIIIPIFDDVMPNPQFNQNPIGWLMRYMPQELNTRVVTVRKVPRK